MPDESPTEAKRDQHIDRMLDAIAAAVPPLLSALEALAHVGRYLHPPHVAALAESAAGAEQPLIDGMKRFRAVSWPARLLTFTVCVEDAADHACKALQRLREAAAAPDGVVGGYRAMRYATEAQEALYPVASMLPPVSRFYIEPALRDDAALNEKLTGADHSRSDVGVLRIDRERAERGGFSLYVPEYYDPARAWPLIMALHGGSGNGADFLWAWLREARSRGAILIGPTALGDTWSLMGPDRDSPNLDAIIERVAQRWNVDRDRMLLTGMSDGGTFAYVSGLREDSPFTHLAPSSASFHPFLLEGLARERLRGLPIYLIHGVLDWMFPVDIARTANAALTAAGASVIYREIADLSHTYPREENPRIMDWFLQV